MNQSVTKAGFFPRFAAYLIDSIILGILLLCIKMPVGFLELAFPDAFLFSNILFCFDIFDILFYVLTVLYFVLFTAFTGTTIGKRLFNLAVVDNEGNKLSFLNALYRETVGKYLSSILYFGYIMIFIDKNNRAFHDYLCDSFVIYSCNIRIIEKRKKVRSTPVNAAPLNAVPVNTAPVYTAPVNAANLYAESDASANTAKMSKVEEERIEDVPTSKVSENI